MGVFKATKKPVTIEAIQLTKANVRDVYQFVYGDLDVNNLPNSSRWHDYVESVISKGLRLKTLESDGQTQVADIGDYIIKGIKGEFYPCKPDIFKATYNYRCRCGEDISFESIGCIYCKN